jgi:hypothetical protein
MNYNGEKCASYIKGRVLTAGETREAGTLLVLWV